MRKKYVLRGRRVMKKIIERFVCIELVAWYFLKDWKINVFENIFFTRVLYRHYFQKLKCTFKKRIWNRVVPKWLLLWFIYFFPQSCISRLIRWLRLTSSFTAGLVIIKQAHILVPILPSKLHQSVDRPLAGPRSFEGIIWTEVRARFMANLL